jgi:hypothetical protein
MEIWSNSSGMGGAAPYYWIVVGYAKGDRVRDEIAQRAFRFGPILALTPE